MRNPDDNEIIRLLKESKKIAVVGLSPKPNRDSNIVARYLISNGYEIIPVNPGKKEILGFKCYKNILEIPDDIDIVDVFLNPSRVPPIVDQAIERNIKIIWFQLGVVNEDGIKKAINSGIQVIFDRCIKQEHTRLLGAT